MKGPVSRTKERSLHASLAAFLALGLIVTLPFAIFREQVSASGIPFGTATAYPTGYGVPQVSDGVTSGDWNGDGLPDLAIVAHPHGAPSTQIEILLNNGRGGFTGGSSIRLSGGTTPGGITSGDWNNDRNLDLAVTDLENGDIDTFLGDGSGGFTTGPILSLASPASETVENITSGDFNHDGQADLSVARETGADSYILYGDGSGAFPTVVQTSGPALGTTAWLSLAAGDFNGDGFGDFAMNFFSGSAMFLEMNDGRGGFSSDGSFFPVTGSSIDLGFAVGDFNGDGFLDVAATNPSNNSVSIFLNDGSGHFTADGTVALPGGVTPSGIAAKDFNGDGFADLAVTDSSSAKVWVLLNESPATLTETIPVPVMAANHTPSYTFHSTGSGTISYGGSCSSATTAAIRGSNTVTFNSLPDGTYSDCTITVTNVDGFPSNVLAVSSFTIGTGGTTGGSGGTGGGTTGGGGTGRVVIPATLRETVPVPTPSTNPAPSYTFTSTESGTVAYSGSCVSDTTFVVNGSNTVAFLPMLNGLHADCTIQETDGAGRKSNVLMVTPFVINAPQIIILQTTTGGTTGSGTTTGGGTGETKKKIDDTTTGIGNTATTTVIATTTPIIPLPVFPVPVATPTEVEIPQPEPVMPAPAVMSSCPENTAGGVFAMIAGEIEWRLCTSLPGIAADFSQLKDAYANANGDIILKIVATVAVLSAALTAFMSGLFLDALDVSEIALVPGRLLALFLTGLGVKKRPVWGTVYDSATKAPLDPVRLELRTAGGKVVATTTTDIDGKFSFFVPAAGSYIILAKKKHFAFPSQKLAGLAHDEVYRNIYRGEAFAVTEKGAVANLNIPIDPQAFDWTIFSTTAGGAMKADAASEKLIAGLVNFFFPIGFAASFVAVVMTADGYNLALFLFAVVAYFIKQKSLFGHPFGYVKDASTGIPVSFGILRIISLATGKPITDVVLDATGRYAYPLPKGEYGVRIDQKLADGTYRTVGKDLSAKEKNGYLAHDFLVTEQDARAYLGFTTKK